MASPLAARANCWRAHLFAFFKRYRRAGEHEQAIAEQQRGESFDPKMGEQIARDIGVR